ncbi:MAG TPA: hypothetical protein VM915_07910 [Verrucomicrobiae bacterium]|jgi:hypothetical protein|nr:hypothetical protein [Verrucomicrobiae bacterium]
MTQLNDQWRLDVVANTDRLVGVAMRQLHDTNEAHVIVHDVMWRAMTDMLAPISARQLDIALDRALAA